MLNKVVLYVWKKVHGESNMDKFFKLMSYGIIIQAVGFFMAIQGPEKYLWHLLGTQLIFCLFCLANILLCFFAEKQLSLLKLLMFCVVLSISPIVLGDFFHVLLQVPFSPNKLEYANILSFITSFVCYSVFSMVFFVLSFGRKNHDNRQ